MRTATWEEFILMKILQKGIQDTQKFFFFLNI